ncbi:hypothetical protein BDZ91DRAFT_72132 [Kalaharituber pfeilii]|nr:hypothetical protein BDZ91DRAFT_72132 [Kalaharituber pfeilii]
MVSMQLDYHLHRLASAQADLFVLCSLSMILLLLPSSSGVNRHRIVSWVVMNIYRFMRMGGMKYVRYNPEETNNHVVTSQSGLLNMPRLAIGDKFIRWC